MGDSNPTQSISIASLNVNSINARLPQTLGWLSRQPIDILLLQELKCINEKFPAEAFEELGYNIATHGQKTYNGVAILSKFPLDDITMGLDNFADEQARYIEAVVSLPNGALRVASAYIPNGQEVGSEKFAYKMRFYDAIYNHWKPRMHYDEPAVLGGDFNCALTAQDVYDHAKLDGSVCYHADERAKLHALMHLGLYDAFRALNPDSAQFSWWDYRAGAYARGNGMRIDYLLTNAQATDKLIRCEIDESPRGQEKPSDHAPVIAHLAV
jgi:exodeoxyribonuclease-3